jgi:hypothetical protein
LLSCEASRSLFYAFTAMIHDVNVFVFAFFIEESARNDSKIHEAELLIQVIDASFLQEDGGSCRVREG